MVANLSGESREEDDFETILSQQKDNFWLSYRALDINKNEMMKLGIELAKRTQQLIVQQGISFVEKNEVRPFSSFRYVVMNKDNTRDQ